MTMIIVLTPTHVQKKESIKAQLDGAIILA